MLLAIELILKELGVSHEVSMPHNMMRHNFISVLYSTKANFRSSCSMRHNHAIIIHSTPSCVIYFSDKEVRFGDAFDGLIVKSQEITDPDFDPTAMELLLRKKYAHCLDKRETDVEWN